jgi:5'-3' exonuclease
MTPKQELEYLKGYIKLSEREAVKRDLLEGFLSNRDKVLLLDADSLLYNVVNFNIGTEHEEDLAKQYEDYHSQVQSICNAIELEGFNIHHVEHCFTTCSNNFRNEIYPDYKGNRPNDKTRHLASLLRYYSIRMLESEGIAVQYSDIYEADDIVAMGAEQLGHDAIIASIDKDLRQIPACHFNYYKEKKGVDEFGDVVRGFKGFSYTTPQEGRELLLKQLLIGDKVDNLYGVKGIGKVKAEKLLKNKNNFGQLRSVVEAYNDTDRLRMNIRLMKL